MSHMVVEPSVAEPSVADPSAASPRVPPPGVRRSSWGRIWEALVDANPVIAKELLATARTPLYLWSMVMTPLLLGVIVMLIARDGSSYVDDPDAGRKLYGVYFFMLAFVLGAVGASLGSTVLVQEHEAGALQALRFSSLSPGRIVIGKFVAVLLALGAVATCTLPLLAYVLSMGGVEVRECAGAMAISLTAGALTASLGIAVSARATQTRRSLLVSLAAAVSVACIVIAWLSEGSRLAVGDRRYDMFGAVDAYFQAPFDSDYVAKLILVPGYIVAAILGFGYTAATSGLMEPNEDRSLPLKRWILGVFSAGLVVVAVVTPRPVFNDDTVSVGMVLVNLLGAVALFVFAGEPVLPTRRMQAHRASRFTQLFLPRCLAPSLVFTVAATAATTFILLNLRDVNEPKAEVFAGWSSLVLATFAGLLGTVAARRGPARARKVAVLTMVGLALLFALLRGNGWHATAIDVIYPVWLDGFEDGAARAVVHASFFLWGLAAATSFFMMFRAVKARRLAAR
jgi:ABC-type transport system involved in cytochrome c biogenesis permease component